MKIWHILYFVGEASSYVDFLLTGWPMPSVATSGQIRKTLARVSAAVFGISYSSPGPQTISLFKLVDKTENL